jgi:O-methyltransferase/methyltransferase family protein
MPPTSSCGIGNVTESNSLVEMAMGYARSRVLCAAARLGLADALGNEGKNVEQLAAECGAHGGSLYRLLRALASLGLVTETRPQFFTLTGLGAPLRKAHPESVWPAIIFWADLLADQWSHLTECVQSGDTAKQVMERKGVASRWSTDPAAPAVFRAVMGTAPSHNYMSIARAWDFSKHATIADLGGGGGGLIAAILEVYPKVKGMLLDRQESIDSAVSRFKANGLAARCKLVGSDLCREVPSGADVHVLKHVLHGYEDDLAIAILRNCRAVLPKEGRLLVIEFVLPDAVADADPELERRLMSDLNMLVVTGGKERTVADWKGLLTKAGFEMRDLIPVSGESVSIIEAQVQGK